MTLQLSHRRLSVRGVLIELGHAPPDERRRVHSEQLTELGIAVDDLTVLLAADDQGKRRCLRQRSKQLGRGKVCAGGAVDGDGRPLGEIEGAVGGQGRHRDSVGRI